MESCILLSKLSNTNISFEQHILESLNSLDDTVLAVLWWSQFAAHIHHLNSFYHTAYIFPLTRETLYLLLKSLFCLTLYFHVFRDTQHDNICHYIISFIANQLSQNSGSLFNINKMIRNTQAMCKQVTVLLKFGTFNIVILDLQIYQCILHL